MKEVFTVCITAKYYYNEEGEKTLLHPDDKTWIDSYWTDESAALAEAKRLWNNDFNEFIERIMVYGRALNVRGCGENEWNGKRDRLIKCWQ